MALNAEMETEEKHQLSAKIDNVKNVLHMLRVVNFKENATVLCNENGLKVTVEDAKCLQANSFIQADMFQEYSVSDELVAFRVSLSVLVDCLNIFGSSQMPGVTTQLNLKYDGTGHPLKLILEEAGVVTDCKISTQDAEETLDFNFGTDRVINKVIMRSESLREVFSELDSSSEYLELRMAPTAPHFRFSTFGTHGTYHTDIPKTSEIMETFKCTAVSCHKYKFSLLKPCNKALALSQKVSFRVDDRGFLCLQFMVTTEDQHTAFVEFFVCPEEEGF